MKYKKFSFKRVTVGIKKLLLFAKVLVASFFLIMISFDETSSQL